MKSYLHKRHCSFLFFLLIVSLQSWSQTAYEWYQTQVSNKQSNDYWANVVVDTVIKLQLVNINTTGPASARYGQAVNLESFLRNKTIIVPAKHRLLTCNVYFTGNGFSIPYVYTLNGQPSFVGLEQVLKKCETGTSIIFDAVRLPDSTRNNIGIVGGCILTNFKKKDLPKLIVDTTIIDAMETLQKRFTRGTIYFTGTGFPVAESMPATESNAISRKKLISRIQPGTSIVFDNCNYWDAEKKIALSVTKTIKLVKTNE